ncbi:MAG TPA: hypothetical protein VNL71_14695 [Chloroflexota bacterium]|nr:hypothetical protein [Chloroflexota bacterium]
MPGTWKLHWAIRWLGLAAVLVLAGGLAGKVASMRLLPAGHVSGDLLPSATSRPSTGATPVPVMLPPHAPNRVLLMRSNGRAAPNGAWIAGRGAWLRVEFAAPRTAVTLRIEAQVAPISRPFTPAFSERGGLVHLAAGRKSQAAIALPSLMDGRRYHWRVRALGVGRQASPWSGGGTFGASMVLPPPPRLVASSVTLNGWSRATQARFRWRESGAHVPIIAYQYVLVQGGSSARVPTHLLWRPAGTSALLPSLAGGQWRLLVRAVNAAGVYSHAAPWPFGLATHVAAPRMVAASPSQGRLGNARIPWLRWRAAASTVPLRGYEYALLPTPARPRTTLSWTFTQASSLRLPALADGVWQVRVRAVDVANNHSPALTWSFRLDRRPPALSAPVLSAASFTPEAEHLGISFSLNKSARVSFSLMRPGTNWSAPLGMGGALGPGAHHLTWNGRIGRRLVPVGRYRIVVRAVDAAGNHGHVATVPVTVRDKWILISEGVS